MLIQIEVTTEELASLLAELVEGIAETQGMLDSPTCVDAGIRAGLEAHITSLTSVYRKLRKES